MRKIRKYKKIFTQGIKVIKYISYLIYSRIFKNQVSIYNNIWLVSVIVNSLETTDIFFISI